MRYILKKGFKSSNGQVEILDADVLCYVVKNKNNGATGVRTISKTLLDEYVDYFEKHPNNTADQARKDLSGRTDIDKFEYGYSSTLTTMAKMILGEQLIQNDKVLSSESAESLIVKDEPLQQIFFGAPGTGKSHEINKKCCKYDHFRITFHPDTDYASFVGTYKPITIKHPVHGAQGQPSRDAEGKVLMEDRIVYRYVAQAFLKAYIAAWKEQEKENPAPVFLIIEEINRGNCAQIFGDIFQLLDRNKLGFSDYPIVADDDLSQELKKVLGDLNVVNAAKINSLYNYKEGQKVVDWVKSGSHLLLPNNLYIWATMNTSDQSLFPIDSAFKRRWDWKYIKIKNSSKNYRIVFSNGNEYDWWEFLMAINDRIEGGDIQQEDKKLGYFFVKTKEDGVISAEMFLSKVIFYLYNDVFKDFGFEEDFFKDETGAVMTFSSYFDQDGVVDEVRVEKFVENLIGKLENLTSEDDDELEEDEENGDKRGPLKTFFLKLGDGTTIKAKKASRVLENFIKHVGVETVWKLKIPTLRGIPFVFKSSDEGFDGWDDRYKRPITGTDYYMNSRFSVDGMIKYLVTPVCEKLGIECSTEILNQSDYIGDETAD